MNKENLKQFVFISSSAVYDVDNFSIPYSEETPMKENKYWTSYGTNKIEAENFLKEKFEDLQLNLIILRPSSFEECKRSLMSTSNTSEIRSNVSNPGCAVLVHHFETVAGSLPNCFANHLLVRFFSASTTFNLLMSFVISIGLTI